MLENVRRVHRPLEQKKLNKKRQKQQHDQVEKEEIGFQARDGNQTYKHSLHTDTARKLSSVQTDTATQTQHINRPSQPHKHST